MRVSALVPCYNSEAFIDQTLDCLAAQTWPDLEILLADDASTDGTLGLLRAFADRHPNARVIARTENLGWLGNSNALMAEATGAAMFFAQHDDLIAPDYVERLAAALSSCPDAILAYCDLHDSGVRANPSVLIFENPAAGRTAFHRARVLANPPYTAWVPYRGLFYRRAFEQIGGLRRNAAGEVSADWPWLFHMSTLGDFVRVPEVLCWKIRRAGSVSSRWGSSKRRRSALTLALIAEARLSPLARAEKALILFSLWRTYLLPKPHLGWGIMTTLRKVRDRCLYHIPLSAWAAGPFRLGRHRGRD